MVTLLSLFLSYDKNIQLENQELNLITDIVVVIIVRGCNAMVGWCWLLYCGGVAAISHYHTSDSRRSYQIIKFLVSLVNKCPLAKDYLLQAATRWQWAVNWLKSKVGISISWVIPQVDVNIFFQLYHADLTVSNELELWFGGHLYIFSI